MMVNSGYGIVQIRKVLINCLTCYERKLAESKKVGGRPLLQSEVQSRDSRTRKKLTGKVDWYKPKKKSKQEETEGEATWREDNRSRKRRTGGGQEQGNWWRSEGIEDNQCHVC